MCGIVCGVSTAVIGAVLVLGSSLVSFLVIPGVVQNMITNEMVLINDTIQVERFEEVPFPLNFTVNIWNITNPAEVLAGGVPVMNEVGPFIYKLYQTRLIDDIEEDLFTYRRLERFEFDAASSFPLTEDVVVTIVNVPYHAILQVAEKMFPLLMPVLNAAINGIFGQYNTPIVNVRIKDLLFDGIPVCRSPGLIGMVACAQIRELSQDTKNLQLQVDGSLLFSLLSYKHEIPSGEYVVYRGLRNEADLGRISLFEGRDHLLYWLDEDGQPGRCNMVNGTDSGIFAPFVDRDQSIYALNTDICRSVDLRYQYDLVYEGIPAVRFAVNEWFLDNDEGCFCLNETAGGLNRENGCQLRGAMELYTCVGAYLVLSYPHFLYADLRLLNGVIGMNPVEEDHRIFVDLEPNTGTVVRGAKRGQFNIYMRPLTAVPATQNLRNILTPIFWIEEGISLPEIFVEELTTKLLFPLNLLEIMIPTVIALCAIVLVAGLVVIARAKFRKPTPNAVPLPAPLPLTNLAR